MARNGTGSSDGPREWQVGFINADSNYLTAETFGFAINASGVAMRKKQVWTIEHDRNDDDIIYIRSHLGRYLSTDKRGKVTCSEDSAGDEQKFSIRYEENDSGKWAFRSATYGTYFGGIKDNLSCNEKAPGRSEWWTMRLAVHPQVNLRNVNRKTYALFEAGNEDTDEDDSIQVKASIPWGEEALITLDFIDGKYALKACNNRYLNREGRLEAERDNDCLYTLQICSGNHSGLAFKDSTGRFLSGVGMKAIMKGRNSVISKDDLFTIEDSHPQVFVTAHNNKKVSIKQGVDLSANQDDNEVTNSETFQLEYDKAAGGWRLRTSADNYWTVETASGIQAKFKDNTSAKGVFHIDYQGEGIIAIKAASNNKYITAKMNGSLYATIDEVTTKEKFTMTILNRPILIFKGEYGFWGFKAQGNTRIECNKHHYEIMFLEHTWGEDGTYFIRAIYRGASKKEMRYLDVDAESNLVASSTEQKPFIFELVGQSRMVIKTPNGKYLKGEQNGQLVAKITDISKATQWEY